MASRDRGECRVVGVVCSGADCGVFIYVCGPLSQVSGAVSVPLEYLLLRLLPSPLSLTRSEWSIGVVGTFVRSCMSSSFSPSASCPSSWSLPFLLVSLFSSSQVCFCSQVMCFSSLLVTFRSSRLFCSSLCASLPSNPVISAPTRLFSDSRPLATQGCLSCKTSGSQLSQTFKLTSLVATASTARTAQITAPI